MSWWEWIATFTFSFGFVYLLTAYKHAMECINVEVINNKISHERYDERIVSLEKSARLQGERILALGDENAQLRKRLDDLSVKDNVKGRLLEILRSSFETMYRGTASDPRLFDPMGEPQLPSLNDPMGDAVIGASSARFSVSGRLATAEEIQSWPSDRGMTINGARAVLAGILREESFGVRVVADELPARPEVQRELLMEKGSEG